MLELRDEILMVDILLFILLEIERSMVQTLSEIFIIDFLPLSLLFLLLRLGLFGQAVFSIPVASPALRSCAVRTSRGAPRWRAR